MDPNKGDIRKIQTKINIISRFLDISTYGRGFLNTAILVVRRRGKVGIDGVIFTTVGAMDLILQGFYGFTLLGDLPLELIDHFVLFGEVFF